MHNAYSQTYPHKYICLWTHTHIHKYMKIHTWLHIYILKILPILIHCHRFLPCLPSCIFVSFFSTVRTWLLTTSVSMLLEIVDILQYFKNRFWIASPIYGYIDILFLCCKSNFKTNSYFFQDSEKWFYQLVCFQFMSKRNPWFKVVFKVTKFVIHLFIWGILSTYQLLIEALETQLWSKQFSALYSVCSSGVGDNT